MPKELSTPQLAWALGHAVVLLSSVYALFGAVTLHPHYKAYYVALLGVLLAWGIVVYKSLGTPQATAQWLRTALLDENLEYLLLGVFWFVQRPIAVTLIPFATFSLFHTLTFIRTTLISRTAAAPTADGKRPAPSAIAKAIQTWVKANYEHAIMFVAYVEVILIFGRLVFGALLFKNSFLAPFIYAHFLRLRYFLSPPTQQAAAHLNRSLSNLVAHPSVPDGVRTGYGHVRGWVDHWLHATRAATGRPAPAPATPANASPATGRSTATPASATATPRS